jgi:hypothetical protein
MHSFGSFIVGGLLWPPRLLIISNAIPDQQPISFHSALGRGLLPKCIHEVFMDFLWGHSFLTQVLNEGYDFNFLLLV